MSTPTELEREIAPLLLDAVHEAFWAVDVEGNIVYLNRPCRECFSRALGVELVPGVNFLEAVRAVHPALYRFWVRSYGTVLAGGEVSEQLVRFELGGSMHDHLVSLFPLRGPPSHVGTLLCSVVKEVTEVRLAEQRFEQTAEKFEAVFRISPVPVVLTAAGEGRILDANQAFAEMVGYDLAEIVGHTTLELGLWVDLEERRRLIEMLNREGRMRGEALRFRKKSGEVRLGSGAFVRMRRGDSDTTVAILEDITDRKRAEARQSELTRLEAVAQLAGGIAHDFNNLLTVILSAAELMESGRLTEPQERRMLAKIHTAGDRAANLTWQLLAYGRRQPLQPRPTDPGAIISGLVTTLGVILGEDIEVRCELAEGKSDVLLDPERFHAALLSMALNARDAMPEGGVLTFRVRSLGPDSAELPADGRGRAWVQVEVEDTGRGIGEQVLPHIFEPFFTTKPLGEGSGLGLSHVYGFVRQSGGQIDVDSAPGEGTRFRILLPAVPPSADVQASPA